VGPFVVCEGDAIGKNPAFQFYPSDWTRDMEEHPLEIEGAWIRILCRLWWSDTPGQLTKSLTSWSRSLRIHHNTLLKTLRYIGDKGIGKVEIEGDVITVVNRRMVRDHEIRVLRSKAGTLGGNPNFEKGKGNPYYKKDNISKIDNQKITPSSSSSSSTTKNNKHGGTGIFHPPDLESVTAYCLERNNSVDSERWHNYYSSNGWKVGKNPMKDWKAAVRTWEKSDFNKPQQTDLSDWSIKP
jgi:hypothetical protein